MRTVLDATVLIDHLRNEPLAIAYLHAFDVPPLCSEVTRIEVHRGVRSAERKAMEAIFELTEWIAVDESIAIDLAVAATAQAHLGCRRRTERASGGQAHSHSKPVLVTRSDELDELVGLGGIGAPRSPVSLARSTSRAPP